MTIQLDSVEAAIAEIAAGRIVIVVDDDDRENEGDLIMAAAKAEAGAGRVHDPAHERHPVHAVAVETARRLRLDPMVARNDAPLGTAFTVSVDYRFGLTTGISAKERRTRSARSPTPTRPRTTSSGRATSSR